MNISEIKNFEVEQVINTIKYIYGYDFSEYSKASFRRRINDIRTKKGLDNISDLIPLLIHDKEFFNSILHNLTITTTEMFRDPGFFKHIIEKVIPALKTYPFIKIWHAGCSTGEEVYSMAILLKKYDLLKKTQIYATDINKLALKKAKEGIFDVKLLKEYKKNYCCIFDDNDFLDYFTIKYSAGKILPELQKRITFSFHNLSTDAVFNEVQLLLCRNVMIYFNKKLQEKALLTFNDSLCRSGFLCLGDKESLQFSNINENFKIISGKFKIYKKKI
jgi:chemotaxis protein methyltransferase CheR